MLKRISILLPLEMLILFIFELLNQNLSILIIEKAKLRIWSISSATCNLSIAASEFFKYLGDFNFGDILVVILFLLKVYNLFKSLLFNFVYL